jgi:hypothetical protein
MNVREYRLRLARERRAKGMRNQAVGNAGGNPLLAAVCREFEKRGFTELPCRDGDAIHVDCWYAPPEPPHYKDGRGQARLEVTINCSHPTHVYVAAPGAFDTRTARDKAAVAAAMPILEQEVGGVELAYNEGSGVVMPYVRVPNADMAANPMLAFKAIARLLTRVHQLAPVMEGLIRTGHAAFDASTFTSPEWTREEHRQHRATLHRRGLTETAQHGRLYTREVVRRLQRHARRYGADPGRTRRVLGQVGRSPSVVTAPLLGNRVVDVYTGSDYRAHPKMLKVLDRILRHERRKPGNRPGRRRVAGATDRIGGSQPSDARAKVNRRKEGATA